MQLVSEVLALGTAALRLPGALRRSGCSARVHAGAAGGRGAHWPVVLVHGYAGSEVVWQPLRRVLTAEGFARVVTVSYDSFGAEVGEVTACIASATRDAATTGARGVHLVGHSLGGLLLRRAVADHDLADLVGAAVTVATPHSGSRLARFAVGSCARLLSPCGAAAEGPAGDGAPRWLSVSSCDDLVVPPTTARLSGRAAQARDVVVQGPGHLTICRDPRVLRLLVDHLLAAEHAGAPDSRPALALARAA